MVARRYLPPATFVAPTGTWPEGPFGVDTPTYALVSARIAIRLKTVMTEQGLSLRAVAGPAAMDPTSLSRLLTGKVVPDLGTIAGLENTLDTDLWPGRL